MLYGRESLVHRGLGQMSNKILLIRFKYRRRSDMAVVLAVALMVGALLINLGIRAGRASGLPTGQTNLPPAIPSSQASPTTLRQYYLTDNASNGATADVQCA